NGDWTGARVFEVTDDTAGEGVTQPPVLQSEPLADLGDVNSGNGETFAQYLVWVLKHYPAQRYIITFGSHGAAWEGVSRDDSEGEDLISLPEMREAFRLGIEQAGIEKFDIVINDACLMASIEYFNVVGNYFDYALASPEIVVDPAHDMSILLNAIRGNPDVPVTDYVDPLIDQYIDIDILRRPGSDVAFLTSTFLDLNKYGSVDTAVSLFADVVRENPALYSSLMGRARANAYVYSGFLGDDALIDLGALMRQIVFLANPATNADLIEAAQGVLTDLQAPVLYG
ncbi:MAG TPA: clostripain-related cysteine peptidase, partial [Aggregatilineales bacterium]|nr:clostripain-related cysteine peptidase [Aggregatilineales bacterium]